MKADFTWRPPRRSGIEAEMSAGALRDGYVRTLLFAQLAVVTVTSLGSYGYFHEDEYFQVLAFAWTKLGALDPARLPWEYAARMRPFLQPALYVALARLAEPFGYTDIFARAALFRCFTGLVSWCALVAFVSVSCPWFRDRGARRAHVLTAAGLGMLPYLFVRTSSETLAMDAFTLGFAAVIARRWAWPVWAGIALGLAFEFRFQSAFLSMGLLAWLLFVRKDRVRELGAMAVAALGIVAVGGVVDRWGYGEWTFAPWNYARMNVIEGAASRFGTAPPFAYLALEVSNLFAPVVVVWLVAFALTVIRHPFHPVTWTVVPFFVVHNLIPHKEERFLFPMVILATSFFVLGFGPHEGRPNAWASAVWRRRRSAGVWLLGAYNFLGMLVLAVHPLGWNHHVPFFKMLHDLRIDDFAADSLVAVKATPYSPAHCDIVLTTPPELEAERNSGRSRPYLILASPRLPPELAAIAGGPTLVGSEMPGWMPPWLRERVIAAAERYNTLARPPLRVLEWWTLYRMTPARPPQSR